MSPVEEQFTFLRSYYPEAQLQLLPGGTTLIIVPNFHLPPGWSHPQTTIKFLAPVGYPYAKPDCFWIELHIRLANGAMPQASNITPIPETNQNHLWFSWHANQWNPNRDNLLTYFRVIEARLKDPR